MTFAFYTLGCKANQFDTQAMENLSVLRGHMLGAFDEKGADAYILNTCTVTAVSDKKSRQMLRRVRRENPDAVVAVCGCFAQMEPETAAELGADVVGGANNHEEFLQAIEKACFEHAEARTLRRVPTVHTRQETFEQLPSGGLAGHTRALLKIQDGCDNYCTYCIIPYSRGHIRSLPLSEIEEEIGKLRKAGYQETVITGIEISSYGVDFGDGTSLIDALECMSRAAGGMRLHLGSLEPRTVTREFCERLVKLPGICPHFHLSLQSGCDATLARMRRKYDTARYYESVQLLREYYPGCLITTDVITGFPGETEEDFEISCEFLRKCGFGAVHVFPYSERKGTPAAAMKQIPRHVREERARDAIARMQDQRQAFLKAQVGHTFDVLFESGRNGVNRGHTQHYVETTVESAENLCGQRRLVRIISVGDDSLKGELVSDD
ncbi:MAG: tRNA (N(6)-L-threonylcarbamoyladenosine(37)-C(2))-methylthiotransferase MtaB [Ruminococcaceae bacterium]|nr:tRNA (N(6)-L-threonylcarbamoyladenosine(37)-C(2))-methylthiotransferase MtaB [Oscillospiraceae bacterium]